MTDERGRWAYSQTENLVFDIYISQIKLKLGSGIF
jgi:hypothetical protein